MLLNSDLLTYVLGNEKQLEAIADTHALPVFAEITVDYLNAVAKALLRNPLAKQYPDVVTFAFWCRKASVEALRAPYREESSRLGRGIAFHISPSNVAVNFAYSLVAGLLAGNVNIVRLPTKEFPQVDLIVKAFQAALEDGFGELKPYLLLVRYGHDATVTEYFSSLCSTRIIWGGDETIANIRKAPLRPRANEITFADRYSICVIQADSYLAHTEKDALAQDFYNDTYLTDQNACTSPRIVVWMGEKTQQAQKEFWNRLQRLAEEKYTLQPVQAVNKLSAFCKLAAAQPNVRKVETPGNLLVRVKVDALSDILMSYRSNSGYFMEYEAKEWKELVPLCKSSCQTLSYFGLNPKDVEAFLLRECPAGIDRVVPVGKTMDFSLIWDGYDLIRSMSRVITIL